MAGECKPYYQPGTTITGRLDTTLAAGMTFMELDAAGDPAFAPEGLSATTEGGNVPVQTCQAALRAFGVAQKDVAIGGLVGIFRGGVVPMLAGAAITAGAEVESNADGKAITLAAGISNGQALNAAAAEDDIIAVALNL